MRLLNLHSLELKIFANVASRPSYIIISHRWYCDEEEVAYHEWLQGVTEFQERIGWKKIVKLCEFVKEKLAKTQVNWIWIDTCCIDKRSSAELSEAINSMFRWYQEAAFCLAFLNDITAVADQPLLLLQPSKWFKRGWTLQELLAPPLVLFMDKDWQALGHKAPECPAVLGLSLENCIQSTPAINTELATITGVPSDVLGDYGKAGDIDIKEKQQWMRHRTTTRLEDMAYCQLGIFGVFMPLLYGEGE